MKFIRPKNLKTVEWELSEETLSLIKAYSEYTDYAENEIVDKFMKNVIEDKGFVEWAMKKRNNKRVLKAFEGLEVENNDELEKTCS